MLIQQLIRQQTISIIDKVLNHDGEQGQNTEKGSKNDGQSEKKYSVEEYGMKLKQSGVLKDDERQIFQILIDKHLEQTQQQGTNKSNKQFSESQAYVMLKTIKRSILQSANNGNAKKPTPSDSQKSNSPTHPTTLINEFTQQIEEKSRPQTLAQQTQQQPINSLSKKLKKQSQLITRNIDRIKKLTTQTQQAVPMILERPQLQQMKISHQLSHKLFHLYKAVYPSSMGNNNKQVDMLDFQNKEQYKTTLNYHKILEMFLQAGIRLEIQNKLTLLRLIKKFAFTKDFVQLEEWIKIYKAIINNLGVKEVAFQRLVRDKQDEKKQAKLMIQAKNTQNVSRIQKPQQGQFRTRRIKTQSSIPQYKFVSLGNIVPQNPHRQTPTKTTYLTNNSIRLIRQEKGEVPKSFNPNEYRSRHKKLLTDVNEVIIKNLKKDLRTEKMIGLRQDLGPNQTDNNFEPQKSLQNNEPSYLKKAIKNKKISKITWQALFEMKQDNMYYNIVIPQFAKGIPNDQF